MQAVKNIPLYSLINMYIYIIYLSSLETEKKMKSDNLSRRLNYAGSLKPLESGTII